MVVMPMSDFDKKVENFFKNYHDRGMKKWAGFFLSDHTLKINKKKAQQKIVYLPKKRMSEEEISEVLLKAFSNHYKVNIQLKERDCNGNLKKDISGFVEGYYENKLIVSGKNIDINDINNIEVDNYL